MKSRMADGVSVSGMADGVSVSGMADDVSVSGMADDVSVSGMAEGVSESGMADDVSVPGMADDVSVSGMADGVSVSGMADGVSESGMADGVPVADNSYALSLKGRILLGSKLVKDDIVRDLVFESTETIWARHGSADVADIKQGENDVHKVTQDVADIKQGENDVHNVTQDVADIKQGENDVHNVTQDVADIKQGPRYASFKQHLHCNLDTECQHGEDEGNTVPSVRLAVDACIPSRCALRRTSGVLGSRDYCMPVFVRCNGVYDCTGHEDEARVWRLCVTGLFLQMIILTCGTADQLLKGRDYSFGVMVVLNFVLFLLISVGQAFIYWSVALALASRLLAEQDGACV
nr:hypothetical protein BaRGS_002709 [Batillaria attramentaria]